MTKTKTTLLKAVTRSVQEETETLEIPRTADYQMVYLQDLKMAIQEVLLLILQETTGILKMAPLLITAEPLARQEVRFRVEIIHVLCQCVQIAALQEIPGDLINLLPREGPMIKAGWPDKVKITRQVIINQGLSINQISITMATPVHVLQVELMNGVLSKVQIRQMAKVIALPGVLQA